MISPARRAGKSPSTIPITVRTANGSIPPQKKVPTWNDKHHDFLQSHDPAFVTELQEKLGGKFHNFFNITYGAFQDKGNEENTKHGTTITMKLFSGTELTSATAIFYTVKQDDPNIQVEIWQNGSKRDELTLSINGADKSFANDGKRLAQTMADYLPDSISPTILLDDACAWRVAGEYRQLIQARILGATTGRRAAAAS